MNHQKIQPITDASKKDASVIGKIEKKSLNTISKMPIEKRKITELLPYENNPRTHSERQVSQLARLMGKYGFHDSHAIAVDEEGIIVWGHGRLLAAKKLGLEEVPVEVLPGLSEKDKKALRIADNAIGDASDWDLELLAKELESLNQDGYSLELLALDDSLLEGLGDIFDPGDGLGGGEDITPKDSSTKEIDVEDYEFEHKCPKCGFEYND